MYQCKIRNIVVNTMSKCSTKHWDSPFHQWYEIILLDIQR